MNESLALTLAALAGGVLGVAFFTALWWTVRKGVSSRQPALWFFLSWLARTALVLAGFYLIGANHWQRLLACLLGFTVARPIVARVISASVKPGNVAQDSHAP